MRIVVYISQPVTAKGIITEKSGQRKLSSENIMLIESAVRLKKESGGSVIVVSAGSLNCRFFLREALARGCDRAVLIEDQGMEKHERSLTSLLVASGIRCLGFDVILTGYRTLDNMSSYIGSQIAEWLNILQFSFVKRVMATKDGVIAVRSLNGVEQTVRMLSPCLITLLNTQGNTGALTVVNVLRAFDTEIEILGYEEQISRLEFCRTRPLVKRSRSAVIRKSKNCERYDLLPQEDFVSNVFETPASVEDAVEAILDRLAALGVIF
ncbi:MAG: hypothetical protein HFH53_07515 [Hespellia sp.]|nr:hypothetical protein [Hespellia sp.]